MLSSISACLFRICTGVSVQDVDTLDPYRSGNTLQWEAFESLQPGQVLVVDSNRAATAASGGDMLMTRAWNRGAAAVVTDGVCGTATCYRGCRFQPTRRR